jgi:hypothetical protein
MNKKEIKKRLPKELYLNAKKDKRGKGELKKSVHIRLDESDFKEMEQLMKNLDISKSNFVRYAIKLGLEDIENRLKEHEEK